MERRSHPPLGADLPDHGDDDTNFWLMREILFEDHDVLMLYNPSLDGIEHDEMSAARTSTPTTGSSHSRRSEAASTVASTARR